MSSQVRNYRSRLFRVLRFFFFSNLICAASLLVLAFYYRKRVSRLEDSVRFLARVNVGLQSSFRDSVHFITNDVFSVSSSFVSNVVSVSKTSSNVANSDFKKFDSKASSIDSSSDPAPELPPIQFNGYFEISGNPYIRVRNKYYTVGDILLGYPIEGISPDVVEYRGKYWKIDPSDNFTKVKTEVK